MGILVFQVDRVLDGFNIPLVIPLPFSLLPLPEEPLNKPAPLFFIIFNVKEMGFLCSSDQRIEGIEHDLFPIQVGGKSQYLPGLEGQKGILSRRIREDALVRVEKEDVLT